MAKVTREEQEAAILGILQNNWEYAVDLLTMQLMEGVDGDGAQLDHYRDKAYAEMKLELNPKGVTDLKLTGDFHDSIYLKSDKWPVEFDASDWKKQHLVSVYGKGILQLEDSRIKTLVDHIKEDILKYYSRLYKL